MSETPEGTATSSKDGDADEFGTTHWGYGESPQEACDNANAEAKARAKSKGTCVTTTAIPGTETCTPGGPKGWQAWAVSANHKGSC